MPWVFDALAERNRPSGVLPRFRIMQATEHADDLPIFLIGFARDVTNRMLGSDDRSNPSKLPLQAPTGFKTLCYRFQGMLPIDDRGVPMFTDIKPGPKPKREDGNDDERRRVAPPNEKKHPNLPGHKHKPGD